MAGGKDPYEVKRSKNYPDEWAVYKNGQETGDHFKWRAMARHRVRILNIQAHGGKP